MVSSPASVSTVASCSSGLKFGKTQSSSPPSVAANPSRDTFIPRAPVLTIDRLCSAGVARGEVSPAPVHMTRFSPTRKLVKTITVVGLEQLLNQPLSACENGRGCPPEKSPPAVARRSPNDGSVCNRISWRVVHELEPDAV